MKPGSAALILVIWLAIEESLFFHFASPTMLPPIAFHAFLKPLA